MRFWEQLSRLRSPLPLPRVRGQRLVVYNRVDSFGLTFAQGYFSEFHAVLGAVRYAEQHGAREVLVQFDTGYYLDAGQGPNWWAYFFEELIPVNPEPGKAGEVHCRGWHRYGPHFFNDSWVDLATPTNSAQTPYPVGAAESLRECRRLAKRYIRIKPAIVEAVDGYLKEHAQGADFVLGVHFRGTDKTTDHPAQRPSFDAYERQIERILGHYAPQRPRLFVASDQLECVEWAARRYASQAFFLAGAPVSSADKPSLAVHKDPRFSPYVKARAAVMKCLLLARCDHLLKNRSGLSDCSLELNERLPWTMLLGERVAHCDLLGAPV
jgi:hypothetical protein